ncbi:MAG: hypothetical protein IT168_25335 [Bryobacterales bacterium]|nr:hypothetical protein [Bryobacterales bacterium]
MPNPALLLPLLFAQAPESGFAIQVVVQTEFEFGPSKRAMKSEFWILSEEQTYEKRGTQVRQVMPFVPPPAAKENIHTIGFANEPDFRLWKVNDSSETRTVQGRTCTPITASVIADYAEAQLRFWMCPRADERETKLNAIVARAVTLRYPNLEREALKLLQSRANRIALEAESEIEGPIAPLMKLTARVLSLDAKQVEGNLAIPPVGGRDAR